MKPEAPWIKRSSYGIKFTDNIQSTEYDEEIEISEDDNDKSTHRPINPILKRLYIRTQSQHYSRIKYFSKEAEATRDLHDEDEEESKDCSGQDEEYEDDFMQEISQIKERFNGMREKYDLDLNIEIPDDDDYVMQTPVRNN
jgi:hypothetical protein